MGKAPSETKKKKKGRPSLLDIQKRLLKQQKLQDSLRQNPPPNDPHFDTRPPNPSRRNSSRRTPNPDGAYPASDWVSGGGEDDDDERLEKKHRLLLGLDSQGPSFPANTPSALPSASSFGADSNASFDDHEAAINWRRISGGSDYPSEKLSKVTDTRNGSQVESGPTTPLPDKKLLVFILERLQKKDTYGVFSEPVDPEELPDYHDIIKHPMDFGTVRKKLDGGAYANLEQFEADIFLICSNAMEYNAPDTVFFRQARAMQDIAKKDFENLRQDSDSEPEQPKVVRRGRPPGSGRGLKKLPEKPPVDYVSTDVSSDANPSNGDNSCWLKTYNLRREPPVPDPGPSDSIGNGIHRTSYADSQANWFADLENEFPASVWKAVLKNGKKLHPSEENKRDTYRSQSSSGHDQPVLSIVEGEVKHLAAVGAHLNHGYARSLARFAANLGPIVWNIASKKIASVLPCGIDFGPGWVGEKERMEQQQLGRLKTYTSSEYPCKVPPIATAGSSVIDEGGCSHQSGQDMETFRRLNSQAKLLSSCDSADVKSLNHSRASCFPNEIRSGVQAMPTLRS